MKLLKHMLPWDSIRLQRKCLEIYGANIAPSEANASINLNELLQIVAGATWWAPMEK